MGKCTIGLSAPWVMRGDDAVSRVVSADGRSRLSFDATGHLKVVDVPSSTAVWTSSNRGGVAGWSCAFQLDGNLAIYDEAGQQVWESGTAGHPNALLMVQNDGNVVIYDPWPDAIWATGTVR